MISNVWPPPAWSDSMNQRSPAASAIAPALPSRVRRFSIAAMIGPFSPYPSTRQQRQRYIGAPEYASRSRDAGMWHGRAAIGGLLPLPIGERGGVRGLRSRGWSPSPPPSPRWGEGEFRRAATAVCGYQQRLAQDLS